MGSQAVYVVNTHSPDLFVRITDLNTAAPTVVTNGKRIDNNPDPGYQGNPVQLEIGSDGFGWVNWVSWLQGDPIPPDGAAGNEDRPAGGGTLQVYSP